jgi:hypothetical protein
VRLIYMAHTLPLVENAFQAVFTRLVYKLRWGLKIPGVTEAAPHALT